MDDGQVQTRGRTYYAGTDLEFTDTGRFVARCRYHDCRTVVTGTLEAIRRGKACHGSWKITKIIATPGKRRECNGTCLNARGPLCDCKCNGANHGAGWSA